jgi:biopolymer transport protein ExbB
MSNDLAGTGLTHIWTQGDGVTRTVALVLLLMSLLSWVIILSKVIEQRLHQRQAQACNAFWHSSDFSHGLQLLEDTSRNPFRTLVLEGRQATRHILHQDGDTTTQTSATGSSGP